jgi:acyl dehydratase
VDVSELKEKWTGWTFDEVRFEIEAEALSEFSLACGETVSRYTDPNDPNFQAAPSYAARFHGRRQLPEGFPVDLATSFDGGKSVEWKAPIRPGDCVVARSHIHDIFEKTGRSGGMMFIVHRMEFSNQDDQLVAIVDWKMIQKLK